MKKIILFSVVAAMLISIIGLTGYAAADVSLTSAWGYAVPSKSDDFNLSINQSGDIIVAEMDLVNKESNHSLYATLSYKKPDGTVETSDIKLINAYKMNPTPCVYFYIDRNYSAYCDMFVTFIDHDTLKPYVEAINVNEHFNIEQDKFEVNGVVTAIDPIKKTIIFEPTKQVTDKDGNIIMDYRAGLGMVYSINSEYVDVDEYLMHNVDIIFAANDDDFTLVNITDGRGGTLVVMAENLSEGRAIISNDRTAVEYYESDEASIATKANVNSNIPVFVNGYDISGSCGYPIDLYTLFDGTDASLEFVENDGDDCYDAIVATVYEHAIVDSVITDSERIVFADGDSIRFDFADSSQSVEFVNGAGRKIALSEIESGDVLAMCVKYDYLSPNGGRLNLPAAKKFEQYGNAIKIVDIGKNTVSGTIDRYELPSKIYIDGVPYKCGNFVDGNYRLVYDENDNVKIGSEGVFYLDINKRIIGFNGRSGGEYCGYILQSAFVDADFDGTWQIKMLTDNGNGPQTYSVDERLNFNGTVYRNMTGDESCLACYTRDGENYFKNNPSANVVKYKLKDGKINYISTVTDTTRINDDSIYKQTTGKVGNNLLADKSIIFDISSDNIDMTETKPLYKLTGNFMCRGYVAGNFDKEWSVFVITAAKKYTECGGGGSSSGGSGGGGGSSSVAISDAQMCIVKSFNLTAYDEEDALAVTYTTGGVDDYKTAIFTPGSTTNGVVEYSDLKVGDVFVEDDANGVVSEYTVLAQMTDNGITVVPGAFDKVYGTQFSGKSGLENGVDYIYGYIDNFSKIGTLVKMDIVYGNAIDDVYTVTIKNDANMYTYTDGKRIQITAGEWDGDTVELPGNGKCSPVFVKMHDGVVTDIYTLNTRVDIAVVTMGASV